MNKIRCRICGLSFHQITQTHLLKFHNLKMKDYRSLYPDSPLFSEYLKRKLKDTCSHAMAGRHHSKETKRKISESRLGICTWDEETKRRISQMRKIDNNGWLRRKHKAKSLAKMSRIKIGNKNPNWKGGISFEPYSNIFNEKLKKQIRQRDKFTCQLCIIAEIQYYRNLDIHHIDYNKKNNHPRNLISLCGSCNIKVNTDREFWESFFKKLMGLSTRKQIQIEVFG